MQKIINRNIILILVSFSLFSPISICAQIYATESSEIIFFSEALLENIEAVNNSTASLFNTFTQEIVFRIPINSFEFKKELMQEHFNESYMESDKYPYATFMGKVNETIDLTKNGTHTASVTGILSIHGVEQARTFTGKVTIKDKQVKLNSQFTVLLKDHNIKVPKLVYYKIAEEILVTVNITYKPY